MADEDVDKEIDRLREEAARYDPVDEARPTRAGDYVLLDLTWKPLDGGKGGRDENALIEIGNSGNHADMNAGLEGLSLGRDEGHRGRVGRGRRAGASRARPSATP